MGNEAAASLQSAIRNFDKPQKRGLGLTASRGIRSPEVFCVEEQEEESREMVGVCPRRRPTGRPTH